MKQTLLEQTHARRRRLAETIEIIFGWNWIDLSYSAESRRQIPKLLITLYMADARGEKLSMRDIGRMLNVDLARTNRLYVHMLRERGLVELDEKPKEDRRKIFVKVTPDLRCLVEHNLDKLLQRLEQ